MRSLIELEAVRNKSLAPSRVPILVYHSISDHTNPKFREFTVSPRRFAEQMTYLKQQGHTPLTVTQFVGAMNATYLLPERPVVITFDDGFADFYTNVFPILQHFGFTATLYVTTVFIGSSSRWLRREAETMRPMLNWDQLAEVCASSIECGAHSHSHQQLDTLSEGTARDEIVHCKQILEEKLNKEVLTFAYPYGYHSAALEHLVRAAGYTSACAVKYKMSSMDDDPFSLSRLVVTSEINIDNFTKLLNGTYAPVKTAFKQVRALLWKFVRRGTTKLANTTPIKTAIV